MPSSVSVIVPTKNRPVLLAEALASIDLQMNGVHEVIVINDGGERIDFVVADFRKRLNVRLIDQPHSRGPSFARNCALEVATGDYIAFLDDDDLYLPGHLAKALDMLEANEVDFVYSTAHSSRARLAPGEQPLGCAGACALDFNYDFNSGFLDVLNFIPPLAVVFRSPRSSLARFDASMPVNEDWDMWLRLTRTFGLRAAHVPATTAIYHRIPQPSSLTMSAINGAGNAKALRQFYECYLRIYERWPIAPDSLEKQYRRRVLETFETAFDHYADGLEIGHGWYERMLRVLYDGFRASTDPDKLKGDVEQGLEPKRSATAFC